MQRRRSLFSRLQGLVKEFLGIGGGGNQPSSPILREEGSTSEESFQPLPTSPSSGEAYEEQYVVEETTITPGVVGGTNVEYIPGHYSTNRAGGQTPVYGRYRVAHPMIGDMQDLINTPGTSEITIIIRGTMEKYAGIPAMGKDTAAYVIDVNRMQYMIDETPSNTIEDLINEYLAYEDTEWTEISEIQILNKGDRPQ